MDDAGFWERMLVYFMLGVFPWIFVGVGAWLLHVAHRFMKTARRTTGTVMAVHQSTSYSSSGNSGRSRRVTTYKPVFEYVDDTGQTQRGETFIASTSYNFDIGSQHEILVNPDLPEVVRMPGIMIYGFGAIFLVIGLIFGIVGIFALRAM